MPRPEPAYRDLVLVKFGESQQRTAILLIASALELNYSRRVVKFSRHGFLVPQDVAELALSGDKKKSRTKRGTSSAPVAEFEASDKE